MNHSTALALADGSGWHYGCRNRRLGVRPIGYCADHGPHPTEDEARQCYTQYQRDRVRLDGKCSWTSCEAGRGASRCPDPANRYARIEGDGYAMASLCDQHMTLEAAYEALDLNSPAGDRWWT